VIQFYLFVGSCFIWNPTIQRHW